MELLPSSIFLTRHRLFGLLGATTLSTILVRSIKKRTWRSYCADNHEKCVVSAENRGAIIENILKCASQRCTRLWVILESILRILRWTLFAKILIHCVNVHDDRQCRQGIADIRAPGCQCCPYKRTWRTIQNVDNIGIFYAFRPRKCRDFYLQLVDDV